MTIEGPTPPPTPPELPTVTPPPGLDPFVPLDTLQGSEVAGPGGQIITLLPEFDTNSILVFTKIINDAIQLLRDELNLANFSDTQIFRDVHINIINNTQVEVLFDLLSLDIGGWTAIVNNQIQVIDLENSSLQNYQALIDGFVATDEENINLYNETRNVYNNYITTTEFNELTEAEKAVALSVFNNPLGADVAIADQNTATTIFNTALTTFTNQLNSIVSQDQFQIDQVNAQITIYNDADLNSLSEAEKEQLIADTNAAIQAYNIYSGNRNTELNDLFNQLDADISTYNGHTSDYNVAAPVINRLREAFNLTGDYPEDLPSVPLQPVSYDNLSFLGTVSEESPQQPHPSATLPPPPSGSALAHSADEIDFLIGNIYTFGDLNAYIAERNASLAQAQANISGITSIYTNITEIYQDAVEIVNPIRVSLGLTPPYPENLLQIPLQPVTYPPFAPIDLPNGTMQLSTITAPVPVGSALDYVQFPNPVTLFPNEEELLASAFVDAALRINGIIDRLNAVVASINAEIDRQLFLNQGFDITLPAAFIQRQPDVFLQSSSGSQAFGVGSLAVGLYSVNLERILSRGIFESYAISASMPLPPRLFDAIELITLQIISLSALTATTPVARLLGNRLAGLALSNPAIAVALGLSFTNQLIESLSSGSFSSLVNRTVRNFSRQARILDRQGLLPPELALLAHGSAGQIAELTRAITSGAAFALLGISLSNMSLALGLPSLSLDFLANVDGGSLSDALLADFAGGSGLRDILSNPLSLLFIKSSLAEMLIFNLGFLSTSAAIVIGTSIDNVIQLGLTNNFFQFREALRRELRAQGLRPLQALRVANEAVAFVRSELGGSLLDAIYKPNIDPETIAREVVASRISSDRIEVQRIVQESIDRAIRLGPYETQREFRNRIAQELRSSGLRRTEANFLANQVIQLIETGVLSPLSGISPERLSALRNQIPHDVIDAALGRGPFSSEAEFLAVLRSEMVLSAVRSGASGGILGALDDFDRAVAAIGPGPISLLELAASLKSRVLNLLAGFDPVFAEQLANSTVYTLLGALSIDEVANEENRDPLSLLNQLDVHVHRLQERSNEDVHRRIRNTSQDHVQHRAETINLLDNSLRPAEAFLGSLAGAGGRRRSIDFLGGV